MRRPGTAAPGLLIIAIVLLIGVAGAAPVAARQDASPAAGTPAPVVEPTQAPPPPAETPAATPAVPAQTDVVTLVFWYVNAADEDIIQLFPLATDAGAVASAQSGAASVGTADFPVDGSPPTITFGETTFETYPRPDGVIERWTWVDDFEGARPATLVMQVTATGGAYQDFFGTATFVSRDEGGVGGVLTIALRPPSPAATDEAAAEPAAEEAAPADEAAADAEAAQPDATVEPPTEILTEPEVEGAAPDAGGEVVAEPAA
jgi:hypothetical protein